MALLSRNSIMSVRLLENPNDQQVKEIVKVFHEANDRRFFLFVLKVEPLVEPFIEAMVRGTAVGGQLYVVETRDGIVGAALWFGPGQVSLESEEQRQVGWNQLMEKLDDATRRWFSDVFLVSTLHDVPDKLYGQGGQKAAYHLQLFGVLPQCQRKGYGKALLHHIEEKAKSEGADVVLEAAGTRNVPMYKALGYELLGCGQFVLPEGLGEPLPIHCFRKRF